jgi:hypothetical protein
LKLNFILHNKGLAFIVNLLGELGRDSVMGCGVLDNETFVTLHTLEDSRLLNCPLSNVRPFLVLVGTLRVLCGMGRLPPGLPVICELLQEIGFNRRGLPV